MRSILALMRRWRLHVIGGIAIMAVAAGVLGQFVPDVQKFLLDRSIIGYLTLLVVIDLAAREVGQREDGSLDFATNQDASMPVLEATVGNGRNTPVDLIEYAGQTTLPLIRAIVRANRPVRILMKHPETVEGIQRQRMITTLDTLYTSIFDGYSPAWEIRCYRLPYSVRARKIGTELLEVGWLTPDPRRNTAYGHSNPSLLLKASAPQNAVFVEFFERSFDELWQHSDSEDGAAVLARMSTL